MKKLFYLLSLLLATVLANAAELNVYASGLKIMGMTDDRQLSISYFLNAPADEVEFQLLNGLTKEVERTIALSGKDKGVNTAVIDLSAVTDAHYTWAIKAKSNTANTAITYVAGGNDTERNERFNFYTPAGLAVDNNPNSPYFGRIYVTEARDETTTYGKTTGHARKQGVHIFGADLSDVTGQGLEPYTGGVDWNENKSGTPFPNALYGPARITIDDEGYVYICDNGPVADGTSGVWRMNPADPAAAFKDVLNTMKGGVQQIKRGTLYKRINSAVVVGTGREKKLIAVDNVGDGSESKLVSIPLDVDELVHTVEATTLQYLKAKNLNALNTIVRGAYNDYWIFQYVNNKAKADSIGILHINENGEIDVSQKQQYNRRGSGAVSPDGKWLAYNGYEYPNIRILPITYDANKKPTVNFDQGNAELKIPLWYNSNKDNFVDGIAFDVAGNLYFASATSEWFYAYALPKAENTHTTIAPENQQIRIATPRIMAYNLRMERIENKYHFSFYANSNATEANLLFYEMDNDDDDSNDVLAGELRITVVKGENKFEFLTHEIPAAKDNYTEMRWAVQLTGKQNACFGEVYHSDKVLSRAHAVIDNSPESDFFGRIYVGNRIGVGNGEVHVLNYDYSTVLAGGLCGMTQLNSAARPAVDAEGYIYWADFGDTHSGLWVTDPYTLTSTESFFEGTPDNTTGVWKNNSDVIMGGSSCGAHIYGTGKNTKLYLLNEDGTPGSAAANTEYWVYQLGQEDGTILRKWNTAPTKKVDILDDDGANFSIVGTSRGAWVCQNRTLNYNLKDSYSLQFYDNNGERQYCSDGNDLIINGSFGGGMAVSADENQLAMVNGNGNILLFDVAWQGEDPALTLRATYPTNFAAISTMHFDYAGNLVVAGGCFGYANNGMFNDLRVVVFSLPTDKDKNTVIVPAQKKQKLHNMISLFDYEDNSELLAPYVDMDKNVSIFRSLTGGMYNTLCLPFDLSSLNGTPLDGAKAYAYSHSEELGGDIILHFNSTTSLTAGVPYLIEPQENIASPMDFMDVEVAASAAEILGTEDANGIAFNGILAPKELTANDKSILFLVSDNKLAWANTTAEMYGMRGYFAVPEGKYNKLSTRAYINTKESAATGLQTPITDKVTTKFIHNGVLYILRDGEIYTIMGIKVQ